MSQTMTAASPIHHHLQDDLLIAYAAGTLAEGWSLAVASHLALCPPCRARLALAETLGGSMVEERQDTPAENADSWAAVRARITAEVAPVAPSAVAAPVATPRVFPEPLRRHIGGDVDAVRWQKLGGGAAQFRIKVADNETQVRLLRIPAGKPVPEHSHGGRELTLVLSGSFRDGTQNFHRGDIEDADDSVQHQPMANEDADCICLAVTDAPLKFRSRLVRLIQPLIGI